MTATLGESLVELLARAASDLPADVEQALRAARDREARGSAARSALDEVLENVDVARRLRAPLCQDTGTNIWYVHHPTSYRDRDLRKAIVAATRRATKLSYLRPNAVETLTGRNSGDGTGVHAPVVHLETWGKPYLQADVMLKGGGCENVSTQYALPSPELGAGRDLAGVRLAVLDAALKAQGRGCSPGYLGVAVGGDRLVGHLVAKEMLFRLLPDVNPEPGLAELEARLTREINTLGIGPMGYGGETTVLGVKIGCAHRLPASYFVTIAYMCWACRRMSLRYRDGRADYGQTAVSAGCYRCGDKR